MRRPSSVLVVVSWLGAGFLPAQEFADAMEVALEHIAAKEWKAALEMLIGLQEKVTTDGEREQLAQRLDEVGTALSGDAAFADALRAHELALVQWRRLFGDRDHRDVAAGINNVAFCLHALGRAEEALTAYEQAQAMLQHLHGDSDHPDVAQVLNNVASCRRTLGRADEALPQFEQALAMLKRLYGDSNHPNVAQGLNNVASCRQTLGRTDEALPQFERALVMWMGIYGDSDHSNVAIGLNNLAGCLKALGRVGEAMSRYEHALAMWKRLYGDRDHPHVAQAMSNFAGCLEVLGRGGEALRLHKRALTMRKGSYGGRDHPDVAQSLNNVAACLDSLGRPDEALPQFEQALAMWKRLYRDPDHPGVATSLNNIAGCLASLGRAGEALPQYEASLAMSKRLYGDRDHPVVAQSLNNMAVYLVDLGRVSDALPQHERALAMQLRMHGNFDHPDVAKSIGNVAFCQLALGHARDALPQYEASLAMSRRLYGERAQPDVAEVLNSLALCLLSLGRAGEALPPCRQACDLIERLRDESRLSAALRQSLFDHLKRGGAFERLQGIAADGDVVLAMAAAERSRGRDLFDLMEQQRFDPLAEAEQRAQRRGDDATAARLPQLRAELAAVELESDRLLHQMTRLDEAGVADDERQQKRMALLAESDAVVLRRRQLLDERARLLGDVLPVGRVRSAAEIQAVLRDGEMLLEFTVTKDLALVYVLARGGDLEVHRLPKAHEAVARLLPALLARSSRTQVAVRGRDPEAAPAAADATSAARELFTSLIPATVWERIRGNKRVLLSAHRELHRLPFELLVTETKDGKPVHWLDAGPAISYVPSGTALHWLRHRTPDTANDAASLDLLAVGDPGAAGSTPEFPEHGAFVAAVPPDGQGHRLGLRPHDVVVRYDGKEVLHLASLGELRKATDAAIAASTRTDGPIPIEVWREGEVLRLDVQKGPLGVQVAATNPRLAYEGTLASDVQQERIARHGDLERIRMLPRLQGAEAEAKAIVAAWKDRERTATALLGEQATEAAVFDLASKAKYLHFACHGIAEEYAGQSLSMLVLSQPKDVLPGDDGLLKLGDLLHSWRGRLSSCRLVVLSACRTNVGPTLRDEAPQALPLGFLFAGAPAVISSLWAVDDASTRELMTDFYGRLLAGETDQLNAFTDAKKALRAKYPDPFHWAPFLYMGAPE